MMKRTFVCCCLLFCLLLSACGAPAAPADPPSSVPMIGGNTTASSQTTTTTTTDTATQTTVTTTRPNDSQETVGQRIAQLACSLLGTSFKYGGTGPSEFDNPGFVYSCYKQHGINIPRRSANMAEGGREVAKEELAEGDIVMFSHEVGGPAAFVGIYVGDGNFVACHNPEKGTVLRDMTTKYYQQHYVTARRYW